MGEVAEMLGKDQEVGAILAVVQILNSLESDDARLRVIAYAQSRCIKPAPPSNGLLSQVTQAQYRQQG